MYITLLKRKPEFRMAGRYEIERPGNKVPRVPV